MKRPLTIGLLIILTIGVEAADNRLVLPDTVNFWKVKLNDQELKPTGTLYLLNNLSDNDTVFVYYLTDTPCFIDCPSKIELRDKAGNVKMTLNKNNSDGSAFPLSGQDIRKLLMDNASVYIYFTDHKTENWRPWVFLGQLEMKE